MTRLPRAIGVAALLLWAMAWAPAGAHLPRELKVGFSPSENITELKRHAQPVVDALSRTLKMEVVPFIATDYTGLIEAMRAGRLDVAFLGPQAYVLAHREAGARVILRVQRNKSVHYHAAIITRADSGIRSLKDLKDKTFAYTDAVSAAGYVYPRLMLRQAGVSNPDRYFRSVIFGGGHEQVVLAVFNRKVDAGAVYSNDMKGGDGAWTQFLKQPAQQQAIRVIAYSTPIPNDNVAVSRDLDANLVKRVKQAFQQMARDPHGHKLLVTLYKIDNLVDAKDSDYNTVREAYRQTGARTH